MIIVVFGFVVAVALGCWADCAAWHSQLWIGAKVAIAVASALWMLACHTFGWTVMSYCISPVWFSEYPYRFRATRARQLLAIALWPVTWIAHDMLLFNLTQRLMRERPAYRPQDRL